MTDAQAPTDTDSPNEVQRLRQENQILSQTILQLQQKLQMTAQDAQNLVANAQTQIDGLDGSQNGAQDAESDSEAQAATPQGEA